jgi:putative oxidoreductase
MKIVNLLVRILFGAAFVAFGLNFFLHYMPTPPMEGAPLAFMMGVSNAGYFMPLLGATQLVCGLLILINKWQALATIIIFPVVLHIVLFHASIEPKGLPLSLIHI